MSVKHIEQSIAAIRRKEAEKDKLAITATKSGTNKIAVTVDKDVVTGQVVKFNSPCACIGIDTLSINNVDYSFVDSAGHTVASISGTDGGVFAPGALVSALVNVETKTAYIQNAAKIALSLYTTETAILSASGWENGVYSLEAVYPSETYDVDVYLNETASDAEFDAWIDACITGSASANRLTAKGTVPTIDIPVILKVFKIGAESNVQMLMLGNDASAVFTLETEDGTSNSIDNAVSQESDLSAGKYQFKVL